MKKQKNKNRSKKSGQKAANRKRAVAAQKHAQLLANSDLAKATAATKFPISHCVVGDGIFEKGIGQVILARQVSTYKYAVSVFLVDVWCLGVKNAFYREMSLEDLEGIIENGGGEGIPFEHVKPEYVRKLVESAVDFAKELGFAPHKDYSGAKALFGDIDAGQCHEGFVFGKEGKPYYFSGPHDSPTKVKKILTTLERNVGQGNYEFVVTDAGGDADW